MREQGKPVFLARQTYRQRRIMDAARLLPIAGAFLFCVPILWAPATTAGTETASGTIYLFAVWAGLIILAFALSRRLSAATQDKGTPDTANDAATDATADTTAVTGDH